MVSRRAAIVFVLIFASILATSLALFWLVERPAPTRSNQFSGTVAFEHVETQMSFGPRPTGSRANRETGDYILAKLQEFSWRTSVQEFSYHGTTVRNIVGKNALGRGPVVIIGAHYDTRMLADQDPINPTAPVPGANDGASGVAVLLELARVLNVESVGNEVWLVFFDAEDDGGINAWDWIVGSTYMAEHLTIKPEAMILVDMVGDADQQIYIERNSDPTLSAELFQIAADLGYGRYFIAVPKYAILDDHIPFSELGIPSVDLIDFDYPYWHTTADTTDKVDPDSLEHVGRTIQTFIEEGIRQRELDTQLTLALSCSRSVIAGAVQNSCLIFKTLMGARFSEDVSHSSAIRF